MLWTMTSWLVSGLPGQFMVIWDNSRCSIVFHFDVPGGWRTARHGGRIGALGNFPYDLDLASPSLVNFGSDAD
jgi:hypothetical protein